MSVVERDLQPPAGYAGSEAALYVAQLDDQSARLTEHTRGATPRELEWQPAPGMNTIGMLLAHIAIVEVYWLSVAVQQPFDCEGVLGIGPDDDDIPLAEGGPPAPLMAGKPIEFFDDLLSRARANTKKLVAGWTNADLDVRVERIRKSDGSRWVLNRRWILYHVLEHEAGHYGQINLLRHQFRLARPRD